ncbi:hypothetical protein [Bacillus rubiinfantis]|uniref:hypothetical protein n=1 Tax=Bacillus rubiinfantis TaxID=1499680 RepID=UPI0005A60358|nr:hypothetical protein [Bacillus rubiinfantis]
MHSPNHLEQITINILAENGPLLGSELKKLLQGKTELTDAYARKIIQRTTESGGILSTKPVSFQRGQFLYYLESQNPFDSLADVLKHKRKGLYRAFKGLLHNRGIASKSELHKWAASVTNASFFPKNDSIEKLEGELRYLSILHSEDNYNGVHYIRGNPNFNPSNEAYFYRYRAEIINRLLLSEFINWLERSNMLAWKQTSILDMSLNRVDYNGHFWDAVGYTYLYGFYQTKYNQQDKEKTPSLVFIESNLHRHTYLEDIEGFCTRVEMQSARMKNFSVGSRILPILFYQSISNEAFDLAKTKGLLMFNARDWLGRNTNDLIDFLIAFPVKSNSTLERCNNLLSIVESQGRENSPILNELYIIKHSTIYTQKGWNCRRHVSYTIQDQSYFADWILFDQKGNPNLCFFISKKLQEYIDMNRINNEVAFFQSIYDRLSIEKRKVGLMLFNELGRIKYELI